MISDDGMAMKIMLEITIHVEVNTIVVASSTINHQAQKSQESKQSA